MIEAIHGWFSPFAAWAYAHQDTIEVVALFIIAVGIFQNLIYLLQLPIAWQELRAHQKERESDRIWKLLTSENVPGISLLIPAYNEEATVVANVHSILALNFPKFEALIINDGSRDRTLDRLIEAFGLVPVERAWEAAVPHQSVRGLYASPEYPGLLVIDKENGGKADAINAGINLARMPLFCAVDADSLLEPDALLRAVRPFIEHPAQTVAVGGTVRVANGCRIYAGQVEEVGLARRFLPLVQSMEYIRAFLMARLAWSRLGILTIISGAFGIFRREIVIEAGGYDPGTVGEDLDLVLRMHRFLRDRQQAYSISFVPEPVCWTEVPEDLGTLGRQRKRWQRGALESFFSNRAMLCHPRYGRIGMAGLPLMLVIDVLGPLLEVAGYILIPLFWAMGVLSLDFMLAFVALTFMYGVFVSCGALALEEKELRRYPKARDLALLSMVAVMENFGYRQLNNFWRIGGWWQFIRRRKDWGVMKRKGFSG